MPSEILVKEIYIPDSKISLVSFVLHEFPLTADRSFIRIRFFFFLSFLFFFFSSWYLLLNLHTKTSRWGLKKSTNAPPRDNTKIPFSSKRTENSMLSSHVKISPLLWLHDKSRLAHPKTIEVKWFGISLVSI